MDLRVKFEHTCEVSSLYRCLESNLLDRFVLLYTNFCPHLCLRSENK